MKEEEIAGRGEIIIQKFGREIAFVEEQVKRRYLQCRKVENKEQRKRNGTNSGTGETNEEKRLLRRNNNAENF